MLKFIHRLFIVVLKSEAMKLFFTTVLLTVLSLFAMAQSTAIVIGKIDTIYSKILDEQRPVWIYNPANETINVGSQKEYPVIYLLDGDWHFVSVVGMLQQLSFINGNTICPEMIVVGIPVKDRYRDFTPTCDSMFSRSSGGYDKFISFVKNELMPYMSSNYPVASFKLFIGHSLGGLTVMNTLINDPGLFNAYIAIDPSMWWDNQKILKSTQDKLSTTSYENVSLFLAMANTMNKGMDTTRVKLDQTRGTLPIRSLLTLEKTLNATTGHNLNYLVKYYPNENHGSVPLMATYDAFRFVFDFYGLGLTKVDYADTTMLLAERIENHYKNISDKMGYKINPSESLINTLGYNALYLKNNPLAAYFFQLNIINYPESYNVYDSMGDYYLATGDKIKSIDMFRKSLSIKEIPAIREKLEQLDNE